MQTLEEIAREVAARHGYSGTSGLSEEILAALQAERERCATIADQWHKDGHHVLLHAGEMTAQELRTAQAVAGGIAAAIRNQP